MEIVEPYNQHSLSVREQVFADTYLATLDVRAAGRAANYAESMIRSNCYRWVSSPALKPKLYNFIHDELRRRRQETAFGPEQIVQRLQQIAFADPNELTSQWVGNCRYCWGKDHAYQWELDEFKEALAHAEAKGKPMPDVTGGFDYLKAREPNDECPKCCGDGVPHLVLRDTRFLSPDGQALFAGIKKTKDGVEIKSHSQVEALQLLARINGMLIDRKEHSGPGGAPIAVGPIVTTDANEAARAYADMMKGG